LISRAVNFDPIARPYRWLEYFSFGPFLERCRFHHLKDLANCHCALILGDGDGRFTAKLLDSNPRITVDAVDASGKMLALLRKRVSALGVPAVRRLQTAHLRAQALFPGAAPYDLVVTHFFLDCLDEEEVASLIAKVTPHLAPKALWLISEFSIPAHQPAAFFCKLVVGSLYWIFGIVTGLPIRNLPDYSPALKDAHFVLRNNRKWLGGLLTSELWQYHPPA
jgi:cyclopropane fatty-acyl-phospholipid synthase-like methyltransferase